jgi:peptidoglycan/LPS O-acetylase OafA/YrhL
MVAYLAIQVKGWDFYRVHLAYVLNYHAEYLTELTSPFWSLDVEVHFYAVAALVVALMGARGLLALPVLGLAVTALRVYLREPISTMTHLRVDEILAGATLGLV